MNTITIIVSLFVVIVVAAILFAMAARFRHPRKHFGGAVQPSTTTDDPRTTESNALYSPLMGRVVNYKTNGSKYMPPNSNAQIKTIMENAAAENFGNLIEILSKRTNNLPQLLTTLGESPTDDKVYNLLTDIHSTGVDTASDMIRGKHLARKYHSYVKRHLGKMPAKPNYLDLGGKEGGITLAFAELINTNKIHVVEVDKYDTPGIKYHIVDDGGEYKLPYKDNSFDVISAFMVLHHIKNLPSMLSEVSRILKPGGRFIVADHDCWDAYDAMLIDIEHLIYMVGGENFDPKKDEWYMRYFARDQLNRMISPLKSIGYGYVSSVKPNIAANRKFWSVYVGS